MSLTVWGLGPVAAASHRVEIAHPIRLQPSEQAKSPSPCAAYEAAVHNFKPYVAVAAGCC